MPLRLSLWMLCLLTLFSSLPSSTFAQTTPNTTAPFAEGKASHYHSNLNKKFTTNGEAYDTRALTAAHRFLPFGTKVRVVNSLNNKEVIVRINDRGPFATGQDRIIDLSNAAAAKIGMTRQGVVPVKIYVLDQIPDLFYRMPADFEAWSLQVTSVNTRTLAEHHVRQLGANSMIVETNLPSRKVFRVFYGQFRTKAEATAAKQEMVAKGYPNTFEKYLIDDHWDLVKLDQ